MNKYFKKGQSFSTDIVVVIVIVLFGTLFLVMNQINSGDSATNLNGKYEEASKDSKIIVDELKKQEIISTENEVDIEKLLSLDESQIREDLGITNDFAIAFEKDGKLIKIDPENDINCIGSSSIIVNGQNCGE